MLHRIVVRGSLKEVISIAFRLDYGKITPKKSEEKNPKSTNTNVLF